MNTNKNYTYRKYDMESKMTLILPLLYILGFLF